jgi:hypothetical protein
MITVASLSSYMPGRPNSLASAIIRFWHLSVARNRFFVLLCFVLLCFELLASSHSTRFWHLSLSYVGSHHSS